MLTKPSPGYTQSGPLFHAKIRALEKLLQKSLAPFSFAVSLIYPTAPIRLSAKDVPGWTAAESSDAGTDATAAAEEEELDSWSWFRRSEALQRYTDFDKGMQTIATAVREAGGVDGVIGFSQGGAVAALLAAALEHHNPDRKVPTEEQEWVTALREANGGRPLKFAAIYSGFYSWDAALASWLYEPKIATPSLHYLGSLDTVVEEGRSRPLIEVCHEPVVIVHPGGHFVPIAKEWAMPLVGFVKKYAEQ